MLSKISLALNLLLIIAVAYLFYQINSTEDPENSNAPSSGVVQDKPSVPAGGARIAYVNVDSLDTQYQFIKDKTKDLERERQRMEQRITQRMQQAEQRYQEIMQIASSMSQQEQAAAQQELEQMQLDLQQFQEQLTIEFSNKERETQEELRESLMDYLDNLNASGDYDYIMSYGSGSSILLANDSFDITREVIRGLNDSYKAKTSNP